MPWRLEKSKIEQGIAPNPYHVWLSEIMLQQTTVGAVQPYFLKFIDKWPRIEDLAAAPQEEVMHEWAGLGYYARARNLHKCAQVVVKEHGGVFPETQESLKKLPGIGDYTSAAICTIAFNQPATVMDGNIERIMARYHAVQTPLPKAKPELKALAHIYFDEFEERPGDFAQALMDLGAGICIGGAPRCSLCPVAAHCQGRLEGLAEELPRKEKKKPRPKKYGHVYWVENDKGQILMHRRPSKGLLGGVMALPTSEWGLGISTQMPDFIAEAKDIANRPTSIHHIFTHFELELELKTARIKEKSLNEEYFWAPVPDQDNSGFPSLFQKAFVLFTA